MPQVGERDRSPVQDNTGVKHDSVTQKGVTRNVVSRKPLMEA